MALLGSVVLDPNPCSETSDESSYSGNEGSTGYCGGVWAAAGKGHWPEGLHELIKPLRREPHGDRQQELAAAHAEGIGRFRTWLRT
jgi:hypothetical protein